MPATSPFPADPALAGCDWASIVGVDEVGRGALFGPVVAAAVVLPETAIAPLLASGVTDSKRLRSPQREQLAQQIQHLAGAYGLGLASVAEIDRLNILTATGLAMQRALHKLAGSEARVCLVDGNQRIRHWPGPQKTVVGGDRRCLAIAAASILAKVYRDQLVSRLAQQFPGYGLEQHKGYGTRQHSLALAQRGRTWQHRQSFRLPQVSQLSLLAEAQAAGKGD
jgi:ribonuclease HII